MRERGEKTAKGRKPTKGCVDELVAPVDKQGSGGLWGPPQSGPPKAKSLGSLSANSHPSLMGGGSWALCTLSSLPGYMGGA